FFAFLSKPFNSLHRSAPAPGILTRERGVRQPFTLTYSDISVTRFEPSKKLSKHFIRLRTEGQNPRDSTTPKRSAEIANSLLRAGNETGSPLQVGLTPSDSIRCDSFFPQKCLKLSHFVSSQRELSFFFSRNEALDQRTTLEIRGCLIPLAGGDRPAISSTHAS